MESSSVIPLSHKYGVLKDWTIIIHFCIHMFLFSLQVLFPAVISKSYNMELWRNTLHAAYLFKILISLALAWLVKNSWNTLEA